MSPRLAPESDEPNSAIACFSSSTSRALIDSVTWRVALSIVVILASTLLADGEAVGALLAAVARELGLADEARDAVLHRDLDAVVLDAGDGAVTTSPFLTSAADRRERIVWPAA